MVKRAKLTLDQPDIGTEDSAPPVASEAPPARKPEKSQKAKKQAEKDSNLGKTLLIAGLTIVSLVIFKRKIF